MRRSTKEQKIVENEQSFSKLNTKMKAYYSTPSNTRIGLRNNVTSLLAII